jgi:chromosome segregation ATPase
MVGESERSLNAAVKSILEAANQSQSNCASSCSSPFNKMQSLTGQQSDLNEQTRQLMGACNTPRPKLGQGEALMRLAARQEMVRRGLEEVRQEMQTSGQTMNELGQAAQEMEELVQELRDRHADPRLVERQEQILNRLLSAQRSIRKREESEERLSRPGLDPVGRLSPGQVEMGESRREALQRAMLRGSQDPVPAEYRGMVERYLRSLLKDQQ